jgi:hypothetical protein
MLFTATIHYSSVYISSPCSCLANKRSSALYHFKWTIQRKKSRIYKAELDIPSCSKLFAVFTSGRLVASKCEKSQG